MEKAIIFTVVLVVGLAVLALLLTILERLVSRWRFGFLLVFYVGAILALLVAAATAELAGTADWTFLLSLSIAGALVAGMFIRSALSAGRRWKKPRSSRSGG